MSASGLPNFRSAPTAANQSWAGEAPVIACFGDRCLAATLRSAVWGLNTDPVFTVALALEDVLRSLPDLVAEMRLHDTSRQTPTEATRIFTGYVRDATWERERAIVAASPMLGLQTRRIGGLSVLGVPPPELIWTIMRLGGFASSQLNIGGWKPSAESFFVVAPVEGIDVDFPLAVGDVTFTADAGLRQQWRAGVDASGRGNEYLDAFRSTKVAAVTTVHAATVLDAEALGLRRIEAAVSRLTLIGRYSVPVGLNGKPRDYSHMRLQERLRIRRVAGVLARDSARQWVRGLDTATDEVVLTADWLLGMRDALDGVVDVRTVEALRAWRRAALERDPVSAVIALAEGLEYYAAGVSVEPTVHGSRAPSCARRRSRCGGLVRWSERAFVKPSRE